MLIELTLSLPGISATLEGTSNTTDETKTTTDDRAYRAEGSTSTGTTKDT